MSLRHLSGRGAGGGRGPAPTMGHLAGACLVASAVMALADGRFGRRAALRGSLSSTLAGASAALVAVVVRRLARDGAAPSAAVAAAVGFAAGAAQEVPASAALLPLAAWVVAADVRAGRSNSPAAVGGAAIGAGLAAFTRKFWPVAPREPARIRRARTPVGTEPSPRGGGLTVVVNPAAGFSLARNPAEELREELPEARVIEQQEGEDLEALLTEAAADALALGVAGGDGTVNTGAGVALSQRKPLLVVPGGTLNHFARDLGLSSVRDAVEGVRRGQAVAVDVATIDGRVFVNTASFGSYVDLVDARERLEERIGKWPAVAVALWRVIGRSEPVEVELNGRRRRIWMIFVGNCRYHPSGFTPSWRERLDDGQLDVRIVDAGPSWARTRLASAVLTGRLGRCRVYEQTVTDRLRVRCLGPPLRLARDGETFEGSAEFVIEKCADRLTVFLPDK